MYFAPQHLQVCVQVQGKKHVSNPEKKSNPISFICRYQSMTVFKWLEMAYCCLFVAYKCEEKGVKMEWLVPLSCRAP